MTTAVANQRTGHRTELGRYTVPTGERILYGQRVDGVVRITDNPARGRSRAYLVDRGLEQDGNSALKALVADYLGEAERLQEIPMAAHRSSAISSTSPERPVLPGHRSDRRSQADLAKSAISVHPGIDKLNALPDALVRADGGEHGNTATIDITDRPRLPVAGNAHGPQHTMGDMARLELSP